MRTARLSVALAAPLAPNAAMRWAVVSHIVEDLRPRSLLEIGCGEGAFGTRLASRADYLGLEPDGTSFAVARERIQKFGGRVENRPAETLADDSRFQMVCAFEVLEHLEDDLGALASWRELILPGGHLLVSMPAWEQRFGEWDTMVGHYRRYSPDRCRSTLLQAGFSDVRVILYGWPLGYLTENVRNRVAARESRVHERGSQASMQERTAASGRVLQPKALLGVAVQGLSAPFAALQRMRPTTGTGVIALATCP